MVYIPRTYVRAAGIQSEISKMAVTKIAHLENDYRRQVHMAKMDMKKSMREIQHNRVIMKRTVRLYTQKLKEYKKAKENKYFDSLHLNTTATIENNDVPISPHVSSSDIQEDQTDDDFVVVANYGDNKDGCDVDDDENAVSCNVASNTNDLRSESKPAGLDVNPVISHCKEMTDVSLDVDGGGDITAGIHFSMTGNGDCSEVQKKQSFTGSDPESPGNSSTQNTAEKCDGESDLSLPDKGLTVKSTRKRRNGVVSHINIMQLQHRPNLRALFRAVDVLAKVHGVIVTNVNNKEISDPRKLSQERYMSQAAREHANHGTLPSEYLYNMKYGYSLSDKKLEAKSPEIISSRVETPNLEDQNHDRVSSLHHSPRISYSDASGIEVPVRQAKRKISRKSSHDFPVTSKNNAHDSLVNSRKTENNLLLSSKKNIHIFPMNAKRISRSSYHTNDVTDTPTPVLKLPAIKHKTSAGTKHKEGARIPLPKIYSERLFERKISIEETANVQWKTALGKLKLVHFIDTTDL